MPTYVNTSPVVLTIEGRPVAPGVPCTTKSTNKHVVRGHLAPAEPDPADEPATDEPDSPPSIEETS